MPRRSAFTMLTVAAALAFSAVVIPNAIGATTGCRVDFVRHAQWATAYQAGVTMTNLGDPINGWRLEFDFAGGDRLVNGWGATWRQEPGSPHVTADSLPWNPTLPTGVSVTIGFQATWSGTYLPPTNVKINGVSCTGAVTSTPPTTAATTPPTTPPTTSPTTPPTTATVPAPVVRLVGTVHAGVEMGCMLLDTMMNRPMILLVGGDRTIIVPGATVEVYGRFAAPGTVSYCMQGQPFEVLSVRRL